MHIRISAEEVGPLRCLDALPDAQLAILEGMNGIGKTLAVRLLQACTGTLPYPGDSAEWNSLCDGVGELTIEATGLDGGSSILWQADTRRWHRGVNADARELEFQRVDIDGVPASAESARRLLAVERIAGDEDLLQVLAKDAAAEAERVRTWTARYAGSTDSPLARIESLIGDVRAALRVPDRGEFEAIARAVQKLEEEIRSNRARSRDIEERRRDLDAAAELVERIERIRRRAPEAEQQIREIDAQIRSERTGREKLDREITRLAARAALAGPAMRDLANARRTLVRNRESLEGAMANAAVAAAQLGVGELDEVLANRGKKDSQHHLTGLVAEQRLVDRVPVMRELLGDLRARLRQADADGLSGETLLAKVDTRSSLSVAEVREGVAARAEEVDSEPRSQDARDIAADIARTHERIAAFDALIDLLREVAKYRRRVEQNEERVTAALALADVQVAEEMQRVRGERHAGDERLLELAARRAALQEEAGGSGGSSGLTALEGELSDLTDKLRIADGAIGAEMEACAVAASAGRDELEALQGMLESRKARLQRFENDVLESTEFLASPENQWVSSALGIEQASGDAKLEDQIEVHAKCRAALDAVLERLGRFRTDLAAVQGALQNISAHLRGQPNAPVDHRPEMEVWLGNKYSEWFNSGPVRSQLLPAASSDVVLDVARRVICWREGAAELERPLQAFSSGEQAFAYTRARIAAFDESPSPAGNRLIVLDEFGAFIAHDRLIRLTGYLRERLETHSRDQVLIILPLAQDYDDLALRSIGDEGDRYRALAEQVRAKRYAVQVLA